MILRKFQPQDLPEIAELELRAFDVGPYDSGELAEIFFAPGSFNYIAVDENTHRLAGYVVAMGLSDNMCDIESIAVDPDFRRKGVGSLLLDAIESEMALRGFTISVLEVRDRNDAAIMFYSSRGYRTSETIENYYREHMSGSRNALRMSKRIVRLESR